MTPRIGLVIWFALAVAVILGGVTVATYFDSEASSGNTVSGDVFDLRVSEVGPATQNSTTDETEANDVTDTWEDYSHTNATTDPIKNTLRLLNNNQTAGDHVNLSISYVQNDSGTDDLVDDSSATAKSLNVTTFTYNGTDLLATTRITDANGNGRTDLDDLTAANLTYLDGIRATDSVDLRIEISGDATNNDNVIGGDGVDFTLKATSALKSWRDPDRSRNNTIQYG